MKEPRTAPGYPAEMRWVAFGTYDVTRHPRVRVMIEGLREHGVDVSELNVPLHLDTAARVRGLRQPWRLPMMALRLLSCWVRLMIRARRFRGTERPGVVLVGYLGHFDVRLARRLFPRSTVVLDHLVSAEETAADRGLARPGGFLSRALEGVDDRALQAADVVVVDTAMRLPGLPPSPRSRAVVVPVGADASWFEVAATASPSTAPLRVIFFGLFTPLQGTLVIGRALALLRDEPLIDVTMLGTGQDLAECRRLAASHSGVSWRDWVAIQRLPGLVADHDVSLGIFGTTTKARQVVPTKVYQGAAAGCALVTSDTPTQRLALGDAARYVPPGDPEALAEALRALLADRREVATLQRSARDRAESQFAPRTVVVPLLEAVGTARARSDGVSR